MTAGFDDARRRVEGIRDSYESYLRTHFYFRDRRLRESFSSALKDYELLKGPFPEPARDFQRGASARDLARELFPGRSEGLEPALLDQALYKHQEYAIRAAHERQENTVVATGTASGKTECFLYPVLFDLYRQHLNGELRNPGVRALILYPMNALANDQRRRLGNICEKLKESGSAFEPRFGQYIGQTPENRQDRYRNGHARGDERQPGELVFREEMRERPPHIMLTNYSMLEYLLIRPLDSPLFDGGCGRYWKFIILDEAHQYRGARGMEMGMLVSRLKQRLRDGGRQGPHQCIATSATIASGESKGNRQAVASFAENLFGERFSSQNVVFGERRPPEAKGPSRHHAFIRALEGAFLVHEEGEDRVILNRQQDRDAKPLEIALCRECGQHYYIGQRSGGLLDEAIRDPGDCGFGVEYYLPCPDAGLSLCRKCGRLSDSPPDCGHGAAVRVKKCESDGSDPDQIRMCEACGYRRGSVGDPVREIVHGSDDPNAVIAAALHKSLPDASRKVLAFADSRQDAAFFAWYVEDSYKRLRDRNLMLRAMRRRPIDGGGLSVDDLQNRLLKEWEGADMFDESDSDEGRKRRVLESILKEALTDEARLSLAGVGLVKWFVKVPSGISLRPALEPPWNLTDGEARRLLGYLLDQLRTRGALSLPEGPHVPPWKAVSPYGQQAFSKHKPHKRRNVSEWGGEQSDVVRHFLRRLPGAGTPSDEEKGRAVKLMKDLWEAVREYDGDRPEGYRMLARAGGSGEFRLNPRWLRVKLAGSDVYGCDTCARLSVHNIRDICPRGKCRGSLKPAVHERLEENYYRRMYQSADLPAKMRAEEHTAQIESDRAREIQEEFKKGRVNLLSSSTTFEVGVDLGDLEVTFLRNVPPEPFNYIQRAGRAGRREGTPGLALTYCRRNPHDLYHFEDPAERIIESRIRPPRLRMTNKKIIQRHMAAVAFSAFFKHGGNGERFESVEALVGDWKRPSAASDLESFCRNDLPKDSLRRIVPVDMHDAVGLNDNSWINDVAGPDSRFADAEKEVCHDYALVGDGIDSLSSMSRTDSRRIGQLYGRRNAIAGEKTLSFLSRKAVIPKYGFPVDVVELDTHLLDGKVSLQRNLSQAIAEYAPGCKVVANKKEWESCGVKIIPDKQPPVMHYSYSSALDFRQQEGHDSSNWRYLEPTFGFVTPYHKRPKEPRGRARRIYTTRPFFPGFVGSPVEKLLLGVRVTKAQPGKLVILCEGWRRRGFFICRTCGKYEAKRVQSHRSPNEFGCNGALDRFSLGHELVTDVVRLQFPQVNSEEDAYSLGYAVLLGAADALDVPDTDLNVTIAKGGIGSKAAIILYDSVPGGAGLVAQLSEEKETFLRMLSMARERMGGGCGCDSSCYGCLRSYRNQFAHQYLKRTRALHFLDAVSE